MYSFARLKDGSWGVRGPVGALLPGVRVTVSKRDGSESVVTVREVVYTMPEGIALAAIMPTPGLNRPGNRHEHRAPRAPRRWRPCGYPGCSPRHCDECESED